MTLDEMERAARSVRDDHDATGDIPEAEYRALKLSRAVLLLLPVVKAAIASDDSQCDGEADICLETVDEHHPDCSVSLREEELHEVIDTLRRSLTPGEKT